MDLSRLQVSNSFITVNGPFSSTGITTCFHLDVDSYSNWYISDDVLSLSLVVYTPSLEF